MRYTNLGLLFSLLAYLLSCMSIPKNKIYKKLPLAVISYLNSEIAVTGFCFNRNYMRRMVTMLHNGETVYGVIMSAEKYEGDAV